MAANFYSTANRINHRSTNNTDIIPMTFCCWVRPTDLTANRMIMSKSSTPAEIQISFGNQIIPPDTTAADPVIRFYRSYTVTDAVSESATNIMVEDEWNFLAYTFDGTNAAQIYWGDATTLVSEVSYGTQTAPSGTAVSDSGNLQMGRMFTTADHNLLGDLGFYAMWDVELTEAQIRQVQFGMRPVRGSAVRMWCFPYWAQTECRNWSAGNFDDGGYQSLAFPPNPAWPDPPHGSPYGPYVRGHLFQKILSQASSGTLQISGAGTRRAERSAAGELQLSGAVTKRAERATAGEVRFSGAGLRAVSRVLSGSLQFVGSGLRRAERALSGSMQMSGSVTRAVQRTVAGTFQISGAVTKLVSRATTATLQVLGSVLRSIIGGGDPSAKIVSAVVKVREVLRRSVYVALSRSENSSVASNRMDTTEVAEVRGDQASVAQTKKSTTET